MFRFTIRDVLWLTVVVALGIALWIDRNRMAALRVERDQKAMQYERLEHAAHNVGWEPVWNDRQDNVSMYRLRREPRYPSAESGPQP